MKIFKLIPVMTLLLLYCGNCSAQDSRKDMVLLYKFEFLYSCTYPFEIDSGFREEVCSFFPDGLDKKSYLEIDRMSNKIGDEIRLDAKTINEASDGNAYPDRYCVLKYCIDQYESKDMDKMAKGFARRMKKVNPIDYHNY